MQKMLEANPDKRISAEKALEHEFFDILYKQEDENYNEEDNQ